MHPGRSDHGGLFEHNAKGEEDMNERCPVVGAAAVQELQAEVGMGFAKGWTGTFAGLGWMEDAQKETGVAPKLRACRRVGNCFATGVCETWNAITDMDGFDIRRWDCGLCGAYRSA